MMENTNLATQQQRSFFFNDTATTEIYTLSLHDALPIFEDLFNQALSAVAAAQASSDYVSSVSHPAGIRDEDRSEEHTSELQSHLNLVCRLLLEKIKAYAPYASSSSNCSEVFY